MPVVVVESPAKAKTINGYLGKDYTVLASYGHVRDLVGKDGSVDTENGFDMTWEIPADSKKRIKDIADALANDPNLILATDPDREGEAISWHLQEALLNRRGIKKDMPVSRVAFNAITKKAVQDAIASPREIDTPLVHAYLARRALDYLVGFTLSPVLWRKLPGAKSAGRVQSVSLRLIVEREMEIEAFDAREYWSVRAMLETPRGQSFEARLVALAGKKLDRFDLADATQAELAVRAVESRDLSVTAVEAKPATRNPSRALHDLDLAAGGEPQVRHGRQGRDVHRATALRGRATSPICGPTASTWRPRRSTEARDAIADRYGKDYVPGRPRLYKNKAKNAQEAHECIRPTDMAKAADDLRLEKDQKQLYDLIWKRTLASQMEAAKLERTTVTIADRDGQVELRATGQVVVFDGFMKVYTEGRDDDDRRRPTTISACRRSTRRDAAKKVRRRLCRRLRQGPGRGWRRPDRKRRAAYLRPSRQTMAPSWASRASPSRRPATPRRRWSRRWRSWASAAPPPTPRSSRTIVDRGYVRKDGNRLFPEDQGRLVTAFLANYFRRYVGYDFTAGLEDELDQVSAGRCRLQGGARPLLARLQGQCGRDRRAADHRRAGEDQRGAGAAPLPRQGRRVRPPPLPDLRDRAVCRCAPPGRAAPSSGVQQLPRMPLHPPLRPARHGRGAIRGRADAGRRARERRGGLA